MGLTKFFKAYRAKGRFARNDREWQRSPRREELDAEHDLPPRPLTTQEYDLLSWTLEHGSEEAKSFLPQLEGIQAVRSCTCGCPSIRLEVTEGTPLGVTVASRLVCDLVGRTVKGALVGLFLFQDCGKLCELEAYSLDGEAGPPEFGWPTIESLTAFGAAEPGAPPLNESLMEHA